MLFGSVSIGLSFWGPFGIGFWHWFEIILWSWVGLGSVCGRIGFGIWILLGFAWDQDWAVVVFGLFWAFFQ